MASTDTFNTTRGQSTGILNAIDWVALALLIIGGLNWGLIGAANFDLVAAIFGAGSMLSRIIYAIVGLSALWTIAIALRLRSRTA